MPTHILVEGRVKIVSVTLEIVWISVNMGLGRKEKKNFYESNVYDGREELCFQMGVFMGPLSPVQWPGKHC